MSQKYHTKKIQITLIIDATSKDSKTRQSSGKTQEAGTFKSTAPQIDIRTYESQFIKG